MSDKTSQVARAVRLRIGDGTYPTASPLPSERQLMAEFQVSRTTVRRAVDVLSRAGLVQSRAGSGTFVRPQSPGRPTDRSGDRGLLLIVPTFADPYYGEVVEAIEREARLHDLRVIAAQSEYRVDREAERLAEAAADPLIHCAIVVPSTVAAPSPGAAGFSAAAKPLVYLGRWPGGDIAADSIGTDYRQAALEATRHLLTRGDRRIAYVEGQPYLPGFSPRDGYAAALGEAGIEAHPDLTRILDLPSQQAGAEAVAQMIAAKIPFTAVLARNDVTAMGVLHGLRAAGLHVPRDVAVASINNSLLARSVDPPLTSMDPFAQVLGRMAVRLLQDRLDGSTRGAPVHLTVGSALIVRASTAGVSTGPRRKLAQPA